jgi:RNA polymerase sigma factor (sigma-70 family)
MVQDPARAEELASEVFWKLWRSPGAQGGNSGGWLYRTAVRMGLDELRRQNRRRQYEKLLVLFGSSPSPERLHSEEQDQQHVRLVLSTLKVRDSALLVLRSEGLSYLEMAEILHQRDINWDSPAPCAAGVPEGLRETLWRTKWIMHRPFGSMLVWHG